MRLADSPAADNLDDTFLPFVLSTNSLGIVKSTQKRDKNRGIYFSNFIGPLKALKHSSS